MQQVDDPPSLPVGTEVSAKYKGAFCEAKVSKVVRNIKVKIAYKHGLGSGLVSDDAIKSGHLRVGSSVEVRHPDRKEIVEATVTKIQDCSQYTVVFDDGDITTLRRTALCLKSGRHFNESETLDQLPLTHPEHFGNPVMGGRRGRRRGHLNDDSSDEEEESDTKEVVNEKEEHIGKVVCVEQEAKKKDKDKWFPGLVVAPTAQATVRIKVKDEYLVRSFKDGRYYTVPKKEATEFTREAAAKQDGPAVQAALEFLDSNVLPPHWDRDTLFGLDDSSTEEDAEIESDSSDDEPREEKDRFVAQLYKYMDDRGTPLNKVPSIQNRDVDMYRLFRAVQKLGGYNRVTAQNQWKSIALRLGFTPITSSVTNLVKQAFKKFLQPYMEFHRKLGCSMLMTSRNTNRSKGRSLVRARSVASPKPPETPTGKDATIQPQKTPITSTVTVASSPLSTTAVALVSPSSTTTMATIATQSGNEESENTSESSQDAIKSKRSKTPASSSGKVKSLVEKYEEKTTKDEADMPLSKIKAAVSASVKIDEKEKDKEKEKPKEKEVYREQVAGTSSQIRRDSSPSVSATLPKKDKHQQKKPSSTPTTTPHPADDKQRTKRKKDEAPNEKVDVVGSMPVEIGDKLKVYYHEKKVTYEAKVIEIAMQKQTKMFLVHYTGWNNRYDEWVPRERIAENLTKNIKQKGRSSSVGGSSGHAEKHKENPPKPPSVASLTSTASNNSLHSGGSTASTRTTPTTATAIAKRGRGRSDSLPPRSTTPSSVASNSSRTKSPAASGVKRRPTRTLPNTTRRTSNVSDVSLATESDTDSDEPVRRPTRAAKESSHSFKSIGGKLLSKSKVSASAGNSQSDTDNDEDNRRQTGGSASNLSAKSRDFDLDKIRSELKVYQTLKSPSPTSGDRTSTDTKESRGRESANEREFELKSSKLSIVIKDEIKSETKLKTEIAKSSSDSGSESDSFGDDDSQSSDKTTRLENLTKRFQQKINADKQRALEKQPLAGSKSTAERTPAKTRIVEKIIKEREAEKRQETLKAKPIVKDETQNIKAEPMEASTSQDKDSDKEAPRKFNTDFKPKQEKDEEKKSMLPETKCSLIAPARFGPNAVSVSASKNTSVIVEKPLSIAKKAEVLNVKKSPEVTSVKKHVEVTIIKKHPEAPNVKKQFEMTSIKKHVEVTNVKKHPEAPNIKKHIETAKKALAHESPAAPSKKFAEPAYKEVIKIEPPAAGSPSSSSSSSSSSSISSTSSSTRSLPDMSKLDISGTSSSGSLPCFSAATNKDNKFGASISKPISPDIYEFKDPEPFEFEVRKSPMVSATSMLAACSTAAATTVQTTGRKQPQKSTTTTSAAAQEILPNRKKRGSPMKESTSEKAKHAKQEEKQEKLTVSIVADAKLTLTSPSTTSTPVVATAATTAALGVAGPVAPGLVAPTTSSSSIIRQPTLTQSKLNLPASMSSSTSVSTGVPMAAPPIPHTTPQKLEQLPSQGPFDVLRKSPSFNLNINALNEELMQTVQETTRALTDVLQVPTTPPVTESNTTPPTLTPTTTQGLTSIPITMPATITVTMTPPKVTPAKTAPSKAESPKTSPSKMEPPKIESTKPEPSKAVPPTTSTFTPTATPPTTSSPKLVTPPKTGTNSTSIKPTVGSPFVETVKVASNVFELSSSNDGSYSNNESKDTKIELENVKILLSGKANAFDLEPPKYEKPTSIADKVLKAISQKKEEVEKNKEISESTKDKEKDKAKEPISPKEPVSGQKPLGLLPTTLAPLPITSLESVLGTEPLKVNTELPTTSNALLSAGKKDSPILSGFLPSTSSLARRTPLMSPEAKGILEMIPAKNADLNETIQKLECAIQRRTPVAALSVSATTTPTSVAADTFYEDSMDSTDSERRLVIEDVVEESQKSSPLPTRPTSASSTKMSAATQIPSTNKLLSGSVIPQAGVHTPIPIKPTSAATAAPQAPSLPCKLQISTSVAEPTQLPPVALNQGQGAQMAFSSVPPHISTRTPPLEQQRDTKSAHLAVVSDVPASVVLTTSEVLVPQSTASPAMSAFSATSQTAKSFEPTAAIRNITLNPPSKAASGIVIGVEAPQALAMTSGFFLDARTDLRPEDGVVPLADVQLPTVKESPAPNQEESAALLSLSTASASLALEQSDAINLLCEETIPGSPAPAFGGKDDMPLPLPLHRTSGVHEQDIKIDYITDKELGASAAVGVNLQLAAGNMVHATPNSSPNDSASQDESSEDIKKNQGVESELSPRKRRRTRKQSEMTAGEQHNKRRRHVSSVKKNAAGSDSDDNSDSISQRSAISARQQHQQQHQQLQQHQLSAGARPCPYNFLVQLDESLNSEQCIAIILKQIQDLRKTYNMVKSDLASIDRRRKKLRRREREKKQVQNQQQVKLAN